ncbi:hypothetical protein AX17_003152 [Amanita inopinata Kibby_2008]|nr:hypothetical protein AX17_003152 [Amanita inopinata Kibby_2008]
MSFTNISNTETQTTRILLSPSKRPKGNHTHKPREERHGNGKPGSRLGIAKYHEPESGPSNVEEIWKWTMTADAVATCFIRDVFDMKENLLGDADFYWLGRVPCRTVQVIGLVVGLQVYESRILYSIDDGTAVIDCAHRVRLPPQTPNKKQKPTSTRAGTDITIRKPQEMPKPIVRIGVPVKVVGKIHRGFGVRQIVVDEIEPCKTSNDEPKHWRRVRELHKENYSLSEPFIIPPTPAALAPNASEPVEPSSPSTVTSTPGRSVASSPAKPAANKLSPPKLRHPSRLHSRDLTGNTFRIYVKHYMIYAPDITPIYGDSDSGFESDAYNGAPATPTKPRQTSKDRLLTPRQMKNKTATTEETPRPRVRPIGLRDSVPLKAGYEEQSCKRGFTLSYLRHVPELADMAQRVVVAEAKRRVREQGKKENEGRSHSGTTRTSSFSAGSHVIAKDKVKSKMKRLFKWVIVQLLQEGSIVLWDGPMRASGSSDGCISMSRLWKSGSSLIVPDVGADSTVFSTSSRVSRVSEGDRVSEDGLSDAEPDEEGYMPVTPEFLADHVEKAMEESKLRDAVERPVSKVSARGRMPPALDGVTKEDILRRLHKDDRWRFIGEWQVQDALEHLWKQSRVWNIGQERWELTLSKRMPSKNPSQK